MGLPAKKNQKEEFQVDRKDMGPADTLRFNVMTYIVEENYDRAIEELRNYLNGESEFPKFKERIQRHIEHGVDLTNAIRAKRKFPGAASLTMAKQQELNDRFRQHFNELQSVLKTVERVQNELRLDDIRSTVWVVRALINAVFVVTVIAFAMEVSRGLFETAQIVTDDIFISATDWLFKVLHL